MKISGLLIILLTGWIFFHPVFSFGQILTNPHLQFNTFRPIPDIQHKSLTYELNSIFNGNSRFRLYDPESQWFNSLSASLISRLTQNLLFTFQIKYNQSHLYDLHNILETEPYQHDFIFLADTTRGNMSIQNPSFSFQFLYQPIQSLILNQKLSYSFGRAIKDRYTAPINTFLLLEYEPGGTFKFSKRHSLTLILQYQYRKEIIDLADIEEFPPIYVRRYRGFFKYRDITGSFQHYENSHQIGLTAFAESHWDILRHKWGIYTSYQRQSNMDRYLSTNHDDFRSDFREIVLFDSLSYKFSEKWKIQLGFSYSHSIARLINPEANTLAIRETMNQLGMSIGNVFYMSARSFFQSLQVKGTIIITNPDYNDFLENVSYNQKGYFTQFSIAAETSWQNDMKWRTLLEWSQLNNPDFNYLYSVPFYQITVKQDLTIRMQKDHWLIIGIKMAYVKKNMYQKESPIAGIHLKYILPNPIKERN